MHRRTLIAVALAEILAATPVLAGGLEADIRLCQIGGLGRFCCLRAVRKACDRKSLPDRGRFNCLKAGIRRCVRLFPD